MHVIKTHDPDAIEQFCHKRFAAKRANGEWFSLHAADVQVFMRRKFMCLSLLSATSEPRALTAVKRAEATSEALRNVRGIFSLRSSITARKMFFSSLLVPSLRDS